MNNLLRIMSLDEDLMHRVSFVTPREEGGINSVFDPSSDAFIYQVFIHSRFPYSEIFSQEFASFRDARSFAAERFREGWEMLTWDLKAKRPCEEGGYECGSGTCATCASGGGCTSCGTND